MSTVRVNTSDLEWIKRHAPESGVIAYGTDVKGVMYFQADVEVWKVEHVRFAGADMIRFEFIADAPADHSRRAMYPVSYLVEETSTELAQAAADRIAGALREGGGSSDD